MLRVPRAILQYPVTGVRREGDPVTGVDLVFAHEDHLSVPQDARIQAAGRLKALNKDAKNKMLSIELRSSHKEQRCACVSCVGNTRSSRREPADNKDQLPEPGRRRGRARCPAVASTRGI